MLDIQNQSVREKGKGRERERRRDKRDVSFVGCVVEQLTEMLRTNEFH